MSAGLECYSNTERLLEFTFFGGKTDQIEHGKLIENREGSGSHVIDLDFQARFDKMEGVLKSLKGYRESSDGSISSLVYRVIQAFKSILPTFQSDYQKGLSILKTHLQERMDHPNSLLTFLELDNAEELATRHWDQLYRVILSEEYSVMPPANEVSIPYLFNTNQLETFDNLDYREPEDPAEHKAFFNLIFGVRV